MKNILSLILLMSFTVFASSCKQDKSTSNASTSTEPTKPVTTVITPDNSLLNIVKMNKRNLTKNALTKYKKIIDEWFNNGFNGKKAYLKFYKNVKDDTASTNFSKLCQHAEIKEYIQERHEEAAKFVKMTHEGILQELKNYIESDITQTIDLEPEEIKELMDYGITRIYAPDDGRELGLQGMINDLVQTSDFKIPPLILSKEKKISESLKGKNINTIARLISFAENQHAEFHRSPHEIGYLA